MQDYESALKIAVEFEALTDYTEALIFWEKHPEVFGTHYAVIVFDAETKTFGGVATPSDLQAIAGKDSDEARYHCFNILPPTAAEFVEFMAWCVSKQPYVTTIMDEAYYWKKIARHQFPDEFLTNILSAAEAHRSHVAHVPELWENASMSREEATAYFFRCGERAFSEGITEGFFGTYYSLFTAFHKLKTYVSLVYAPVFYAFINAHHTAYMVKFLRAQKKRLDAGENIQFPAQSEPQYEPKPIAATDLKLSHPQIAILYHINQWPITATNATETALKYGQTSGQKLKVTYDSYASDLVRTGKGRYTIKNYDMIEALIIEGRKWLYDKELRKARDNNIK